MTQNPALIGSGLQKNRHHYGGKALDTLEHVGNKVTEQRLNTFGDTAMLALAITLLFALAAAAAFLCLVDSGLKARDAYAQLLREAALMRAGYAVQVEARELRVRRGVRAVTAERRAPGLRPLPAPALSPVLVYAAA
jgi:hypothetical protein